MKFRTEIFPATSDFKITHYDKILAIGSCFTENVGLKLEKSGFQIDINPFGILYNPISAALAVENLISEKLFFENEKEQKQKKTKKSTISCHICQKMY